jgi:ribonuclease BN (tRNA processing enzyme)
MAAGFHSQRFAGLDTLQFLGAGSAFSSELGTTCSVLRTAQDDIWLIDCGRQAPEQLRRAGLSWQQVRGQLVTHVHGDHVFGLEEFALARFYQSTADEPSVLTGGQRPELIAHAAVRGELWEVLAPTLRYRVDAEGTPADGALADYFSIIETSAHEPPRTQRWNHAETFVVPGLAVTARETRHVPGKPCTALELGFQHGAERWSAWWSGDSIFDGAWLQAVGARSTVLFHDCTWAQQPGQVHASFRELVQLSPDLRAKTVLMHHDDDIAERRSEAEAYGFRVALPGDVFDLRSGQLLRRG